MSAEVSKLDVTQTPVLKETAVMKQTDKGELSRIRGILHTMRTTRERENEEDLSAIEVIKQRMEKRNRELYVIRGREQAVTAAIRHLEDLGIAT